MILNNFFRPLHIFPMLLGHQEALPKHLHHSWSQSIQFPENWHICLKTGQVIYKDYWMKMNRKETKCLNGDFIGTISNLQTYILPNLHRKPSIYQPFILPNLHFAKPSNYQISNLQTYILPNLHRKTFNLPILHFTKPTFFSNTQNL